MLFSFNLRRIALIVILLNLLLTLFTLLVFLSKGPKHQKTEAKDGKAIVIDASDDWTDTWGSGFSTEDKKHTVTDSSSEQVVEVWSKAAIGLYLWQHVLDARIGKNVANGMYLFGSKKFPDSGLKLRFRSGPTVTTDSMRKWLTSGSGTKNLLLVLNGRDEEKMESADEWMRELQLMVQTGMQLNVGLVMLGKEDCVNDWVHAYLGSRGGFVRFLFVTYDWQDVDGEEVMQWPLGVATYRNFPPPDQQSLQPLTTSRPFVCNFLGTVYPNSSRQSLASVLKSVNDKYSFLTPAPCLLFERQSWSPVETQDSLSRYLHALSLSDLTLSPSGRNPESYRLFEAMSLGSVPVLDSSPVPMARSSCDPQSFRLLKQHQAPVIFIRNWTQELPQIIDREINHMSRQEKIARRKNLIAWYSDFKLKMRDTLFDAINRKFFHKTTLTAD